MEFAIEIEKSFPDHEGRPGQVGGSKPRREGVAWNEPSKMSDEEVKANLLEARTDMAAAAQRVYDEWEQDDEGNDPVYGSGGICDDVANQIGNVLASRGYEIVEGGQEGDDHAWIIAHNWKVAFSVDIDPNIYESGSGYSWSKIPGVKFSPANIEIFPVSIEDVVDPDELAEHRGKNQADSVVVKSAASRKRLWIDYIRRQAVHERRMTKWLRKYFRDQGQAVLARLASTKSFPDHEGRPGQVGGSLPRDECTDDVLYHGTLAQNVRKIREEGIRPSWGLVGQGVYASDEKSALSWGVAKWCQNRQKNWSEAGPNVKVAVLKLKKEGFEDVGLGDFLSKEGISPDKIIEVKIYRVRDYGKLKEEIKSAEKDLYLGILIDGERKNKNDKIISSVVEKALSDWRFPFKNWDKRLRDEGVEFLGELYDEYGTQALKLLYSTLDIAPDLAVAFDVTNPNVQDFLDRYTMKFARGVNRTVESRLRSTIAAGMKVGEGIREIAKRVRAEYDSISKYGAERIARTETIRASNMAAQFSYEQSGVVEGKEWVTAFDERTCEYCEQMDGKVAPVDGLFWEIGDVVPGIIGKGYEITYEDVAGPPLHPNCFIDGQVPIYTSKGWLPIKQIAVGDFVLSHLGKFRRVIKIFRNRRQNPDCTRIIWGKYRSIAVTDNHPILVNDVWKYAGDIKVGDSIKIMSMGRCPECEKEIPYYFKYCSHTCLSRAITKKQWVSEKHRKLMSEKISKKNIEQYKNGERDRFEQTKKANERTRELCKQNKWILQQEWVKDKTRERNRSEESRKASSERMKKNNPSLIPEVRKRMTESYIKTMLEHPEKHPNRILAQKGYMTSIEKSMKEILDSIGVENIFNYHIGKYWVDFFLPKYNLVIEVDGHYWHKNKFRDMARQKRIESMGYYPMLRYKDSEIKSNSDCVRGEIEKIILNHSNKFGFVDVIVEKVDRWKVKKSRTTYNFSVDKDESYIAKGVAVHNCRCTVVPVVSKEFLPPGGKSYPAPHEGRPGIHGGSRPRTGGSTSEGNVKVRASELTEYEERYVRLWEKENLKAAAKNSDAEKVFNRLTDNRRNETAIINLAGELDINLLAKNGRLFSAEGKIYKPMSSNECHSNAARLFVRKQSDSIVTGFVLNRDGGWRSHSWGLKNNKIIETTYPRFIRYYGVRLVGKEAAAFVEGQRNINQGIFRSYDKIGQTDSRPKKPWQHLIKENKDYVESEYPRDVQGRWANKPGGSTGEVGNRFSETIKLNSLKAWNESQANIMKEIGLSFGEYVTFGRMFAETADELGRIPNLDEFLEHWKEK